MSSGRGYFTPHRSSDLHLTGSVIYSTSYIFKIAYYCHHSFFIFVIKFFVYSVIHTLILLLVISARLSLFVCLSVNGGLPALPTLWALYTVYCTSFTS